MTPENFIKSLTAKVENISSEAIKKANIEFTLNVIDLAPGPGFPSIQFTCEAHKCVIRMCPVPLIGADNMMPNGVSYVLMVISPEELGSQTVALICTSLLETFPLDTLDSTIESLPEESKNIFRLQVEKKSEYNDGLYNNSVLATIEVNDEALGRIVSIMTAQLKNVAKFRGISVKTSSQPPNPFSI